ncbi:hypothetical protein LEP1GSC050_0725 [Leptospira broomii serovar Hurstbridge str. 5399]|uniref:Activator of Hsp90 ATPase homologue 1/2-like C-terminal domain-containing protein n=1 Tax=Leptospira broomii serovar Hurstbridge str. 5399 TaxID=1049789 RepID=T0GP62_9LEPT|nr:SRPBCC family protein [Leptospira broomii]EQA47088.1 hypothetical protein LEP1GSC050_0725 [Leptospira broomii serovar Hurstbridge str. 5399]
MENRIEKRIELDAPVSRVWQALTNHKQFGEWFRAKFETQFAPGQVTLARMTWPGYEDFTFEITVKKMEPERLFSFTWHPYAVDMKMDYSKEEPTLVEFLLEKTHKGTLLTVIESGFEKIPENRRAEAFRMNDGGWSSQLKNINEYVAVHSQR